MTKKDCTPYTNRGVLNNEKCNSNHSWSGSNDCHINSLCSVKKDIIIDWFEFTIKSKNMEEILNDFGLKSCDLIHVKSGLFGYTDTFVYKEKIKFMFNEKDYHYIEEYHQITRW